MQKLIRTFADAMKKEMDVIYRNIERLIAADAADNGECVLLVFGH